MTDPLPRVPGMKCHCLCGILHPDETTLCTDQYETVRPLVARGPERPLQMCLPCAQAHDIRTAAKAIRSAAETFAAQGKRIAYLEDELVDAWHAGYRDGSSLRAVLGMTADEYATWTTGRPDQAATRSPQASSSQQVGDLPPDQCRPVVVQDQDGRDVTVSVLGAQEMTEQGRQALGDLVRAAEQQFRADHPNIGPVLRTVIEAVADKAQAAGLILREASQAAQVTPAATSRVLQGAAATTHLDDLVRLASWAGLDIVAVPASSWTALDTTGQERG
ncbi:hypothetical protein BBK14_01925 [Parafrankia soli]|uniref:Uncharacterized protein n=1 Tax=Parafrankia soli TaxID=2599596 RepID=A0A1S1RKB4_9ACTN|nr:hypothetical protein [Parafrankia soli]OHV46630.1 hypothetical protein BBK14_01925 [Parafrankia soli]